MIHYTYRRQYLVGLRQLYDVLAEHDGPERLISVVQLGSGWQLIWELARPARARLTGGAATAAGAVAVSESGSTAAQRSVAAVALGRAGGRARSEKLSSEERSRIASLGGRAKSGRRK